MFDYAAVAVEIWLQILIAVIDLPYVVDTLVGTEVDHWRNARRYHDRRVYVESERQRRILRLVCQSWRNFADENRHRWIIYNDRSTADPKEHPQALEAIQWGNANPDKLANRARRVLFHVLTDEDMEIFRTAVNNCSSKATTFFVQCADGYEDQIFEYMISHCSKLPMVRCMDLPAPKDCPMPLRSLSAAFPNLITLELGCKSPYKVKHGDAILLPHLEIFGGHISAVPAASFERWNVPALVHLNTPIHRHCDEDAQIALTPIRSLGANLLFLNIYGMRESIRLPVEFWTWCPCLVEFLAFFSWVFFEAPAPADHPLKYLVHWPHYDSWTNPLIEGRTNIEVPVVLHTLQNLPPRVGLMVVWTTWSEYLDILGTQNRYNERERENILIRMNEICASRSILVEDQKGEALDHFLTIESIEKCADEAIVKV